MFSLYIEQVKTLLSPSSLVVLLLFLKQSLAETFLFLPKNYINLQKFNQ